MFVSYAQNFEDVMLWRALQHVDRGFYIDLGAQDPIVDSVSLAFYERGWHGIHVEPTSHYAELLRQNRPDDVVLQAAVGVGGGTIDFFEIPGGGISTASLQVAEQHLARGIDIRKITVLDISLSAIFEMCEDRDIHWLKIDIEGFELEALSSWGDASARPWIIVVESTLPLTQIDSFAEWEPLVLKRGYTYIYTDGLNRYYVSDAHIELKEAFKSPPNVFDRFELNGTSSSTFHHRIDARWEDKLQIAVSECRAAMSEKVTMLNDQIEEMNEQHLNLVHEQTDRERTWLRQLESAAVERQEAEAAAQGRESVLVEQLRVAHEQHLNLVHEQTDRERTWLRQLESAAVERQEAEAAAQGRESILVEQLRVAHEQHLNLVHEQTDRERTWQRQLESAAVERQEAEVAAQGRENVLVEQLRVAHEQHLNLVHEQSDRERTWLRQLESAAVERQEAEAAAQGREGVLVEQLRVAHEQHLNLVHEQSDRERTWLRQLESAAVERQEAEVAAQGRESILVEQLRIANDHALNIGQKLKQLSDRLSASKEHVRSVENHNIYLKNINERMINRHRSEYQEWLSEKRSIVKKSTEREESLSREVTDHKRKAMHLLCNLLETEHRLDVVESSFLGRVSSPLRCFRGGGQMKYWSGNGVVPVNGILDLNFAKREGGMEEKFEISQYIDVEAAYSISELLSYHDKYFIGCAYQTLLKRAPDEDGFKCHLMLLRTGTSKLEILSYLRFSDEGRKSSVELPGLERIVDPYKNTKWLRLKAALKRMLKGEEGGERQLRIIENEIFLNREIVSQRLDGVESVLSELSKVSENLSALKVELRSVKDSTSHSFEYGEFERKSSNISAATEGKSFNELEIIELLHSQASEGKSTKSVNDTEAEVRSVLSYNIVLDSCNPNETIRNLRAILSGSQEALELARLNS